jgi:hypothetical protein
MNMKKTTLTIIYNLIKSILLTGVVFFIAVLLTSCAPQVEESQKEPTRLHMGPRFQDVILTDFADQAFVSENLNTNNDLKSQLSEVESMYEISTQALKKNWLPRAVARQAAVNKNAKSQKFDSQNSVYLNLVYSRIRDDVQDSFKQIDKKIASDSSQVVKLVREKQKVLAKINKEASLLEQLQMTEKFLSDLSLQVKKMPLMPEFKSLFSKQLKQESENLLSSAKSFEANLVRSRNLAEALKSVNDYVATTNTQLSAEDANSLKVGDELVTILQDATDAQSGLQALSYVWSILDENQRTIYFQSASPELFKFFNGKSAADIKCMCEKNCKGFKTKLVLNIGVYPAVKKFGLKNIADLINQKGRDYLFAKVSIASYKSIQNVGEMIVDRILKSTSDKRQDLTQIKDHFRSHLSKGFDTFINSAKNATPEIFLEDNRKSILDFETQTLNIRNKIRQLPTITERKNLLLKQFEILESFLQMPLFSKSVDDDSFALSSDLLDIVSNPAARQYLNSNRADQTNINLAEQTQALTTSALALREFADWKTTTIDQGLSSIKAEEVLSEFKTNSTNQMFFPKSDLLALILSISSQTLKLMQSTFSPLVFINNDNQFLSMQTFLQSPEATVVLAAATDFQNGQRQEVVKASEMSQFLLAVMQFYSATEGIERTQSEILKIRDSEGYSRLQELTDARASLKKLMIALANFISNQLVQPNGLVSKNITFAGKSVISEKYELLDQTRAIEALVRTYELTDIDVYLWTAFDIYFSMNRQLYSKEIKFYQQDTTNQVQSAVDSTTLLESYKSLLRLKPYLNREGQSQFERIFEAWLPEPL